MHPTSRLQRSAFAGLLVPAALAQSLVKDFSPPTVTHPSSNPTSAVTLGGIGYFTASDLLGTELWRTDGTGPGTYRVKDLNPGLASSAPAELTVVGARLFFTADVPGLGRELFVSDGTAGGTRLVRDIHAVADQSSSPAELVAFQGRVWFSADDGVNGRELWSSDGTSAGTISIDIAPGANPSAPASLAVWNGRLWFCAQDARGQELWSSDGTVAGTQQFVDLAPGSSSTPQSITAAQSRLFFTATANGAGRELWVTDGTVAGTRLVADIHPGSGGSFPRELVALGSIVVFAANEPTFGLEPWRSDGTAAGTYLLRDIAAVGTSLPGELTLSAAGGKVFFTASDTGRSLWVTDGSVAGTNQVTPVLSNAGRVAAAFAGVAFTGTTATTGGALWISDGTQAGTVRVAAPDPSFIAAFGPGRVLFRGGDNSTGQELFVSDGTAQGTALVRDITVPTASSSFSEFVDLRGNLFFSPTPSSGWTPWLSDGSEPGTYELNSSIGNPRQRVIWNGEAWFVASTSATSFELCRSDGTPLGTRVAFDLVPGSGTSAPGDLTPATGRLFFTAQTPSSGRDLWCTDGTLLGTLDLGIALPTDTSRPGQLTALGGRCFLAATTPGFGEEPWVSDGTLAGTMRLADLAVGNAGSGPSSFAPLGTRMFFSAVGAMGRELYVSDGTPAGTALFADLFPGSPSSEVTGLVTCGPLLFFHAMPTASVGRELWVTDGTLAGTRMLPELVPGARSPQVSDQVGSSGRWFAVLDDYAHGRELWTSDGTPAGTRMVVDLLPGLGHGVQAGSLIAIPGTSLVAFVGSDGEHGLQLWLSDGTAAGTTRFGRMGTLPGSGASVARNLGVAGERLYFTGGVEGASGEELWVIPLGNLRAAFAVAYGDARCPGTGGRSPRISAFGLPRVGNASFALAVSDALPHAAAVAQLATGQVDLPLGSCRLLAAPLLFALPPIATDAAGSGRSSLPIPAGARFVGLRLTAQYAVVDPAGALFGGLALSGGLLLQVGQ